MILREYKELERQRDELKEAIHWAGRAHECYYFCPCHKSIGAVEKLIKVENELKTIDLGCKITS